MIQLIYLQKIKLSKLIAALNKSINNFLNIYLKDRKVMKKN